jgi:hypothetical protein
MGQDIDDQPNYPCATKARRIQRDALKIGSIAAAELKIEELLNKLTSQDKQMWQMRTNDTRGLKDWRQLLGDLDVFVNCEGES